MSSGAAPTTSTTPPVSAASTAILNIDLTGGSSYTLTAANGAADEARFATLYLTGTPTSAKSVIIPATEKKYTVRTAFTSIAGGITVRTAGGTGVNFGTGQCLDVLCDGTSVVPIGISSALDPSRNLSDVPNTSAARVNLGMGQLAGITSVREPLEVSGSALIVNTSGLVSVIFGAIWPIGSLYFNQIDGTNPATLMGFGTWVSAGVGRVIVGIGTGTDANSSSMSFAVSATGGEYAHKITVSEMPSHTHNFFISEQSNGSAHYPALNPNTNTTSMTGQATSSAGNDGYHNNIQPYETAYIWRRTA